MTKETKQQLADRLLKEIAEENKAAERKSQKGKLFVVDNCQNCPNSDTESTKGYGYAYNRICKVAPKGVKNTLAGYVEWSHEDTKDFKFPSFCPLKSED